MSSGPFKDSKETQLVFRKAAPFLPNNLIKTQLYENSQIFKPCCQSIFPSSYAIIDDYCSIYICRRTIITSKEI